MSKFFTKPFYNRTRELATLNTSYSRVRDKLTGELLMVWGKRRVGKTYLVEHYMQGKEQNGIYYMATRGTAKDQLASIVKYFAEQLQDRFVSASSLTSWRDFFDWLGSRIENWLKLNNANKNQPFVIAIDEFPYLVESDSSISSYFQYGWDRVLSRLPVQLILTGSAMAMMYQEVLDKSAPLYGRISSQILVEPFEVSESRAFLPELSFDKFFDLYAIVGGVPTYLNKLSDKLSFEDNLKQNILNRDSTLASEPDLILKEEFNQSRTYQTILKGIGTGKTKHAELIQSTGLENSQLTAYLRRLLDTKIIHRQSPVTDWGNEKAKVSSYSINENYLRFYFACVFPNISLVATGQVDKLLEIEKGRIQSLQAQAYEECSYNWLIQHLISKNLSFESLGRWWGNNPNTRQVEEIDLVGLDLRSNSILFCEVKNWTKQVGIEVLNQLKSKAPLVKWGRTGRAEYYALVSRSGFTDTLLQMAKLDKNLILIKEDGVLVE